MILNNVQEVAEWRLCVGCGVCAYICPENKVRLVDVIESGIRPLVDGKNCISCDECLKTCPGLDVGHDKPGNDTKYIQALHSGWGPILEVWEGHAADPDIRYCGSSGGAATAIAIYCLERGDMQGVLHVSPALAHPTKNISGYSKTKAELLAATGSRYCPASPCADLGLIEKASGSSVFIGKPCDVQGLRKAQALRSALAAKAGLAISIFCAGTPSSVGTRELLKSVGVNPKDVAGLRYRGKGWPGDFEVTYKDDARTKKQLSYKDSWGFLQKYRPYRCHLCPDGTGEFADISCGDPWYREIGEGESGHSLILVRTEKGRDILRGAINTDYIKADLADPSILERSQQNLFNKRAAVWGRLLAFRFFGLSVPRYEGFPLFSNWLTLSLSDKARSVFGTMRRIVQRKYWKPEKLIQEE
jgi:coenzyme F420 hydrogenase subunit beta